MQVIEFNSAKEQRRVLAKGGIREYNFRNVDELCAFVAGEIRASKKKYVRIAEKAEVCPSTVSNLAHGITHYPRAATLLQILRALGYEVFVRG